MIPQSYRNYVRLLNIKEIKKIPLLINVKTIYGNHPPESFYWLIHSGDPRYYRDHAAIDIDFKLIKQYETKYGTILKSTKTDYFCGRCYKNRTYTIFIPGRYAICGYCDTHMERFVQLIETTIKELGDILFNKYTFLRKSNIYKSIDMDCFNYIFMLTYIK